ncbi:FMN-dependent NADH-azoreductase [Angustibacter sp. McL0619]|uniref:FMN-dependent NADH-azoreductase n=1 Tax=Angustibacter sp. McL0619 TaxID=3415676 RepID=UPI003CEB7A24
MHVIATPRAQSSNTLQVSDAFLSSLSAGHEDLTVDTIDLFRVDLPPLIGDNIEAKYMLMSGQSLDPRLQRSWRRIEELIDQFLAADLYVLSTPMWNFGILHVLKHYIDCLVQPGYAFGFNEIGIPVRPFDYQQPYLRAIFGFIGISDLTFVDFQPTDRHAFREAAYAQAIAQAEELAKSSRWRVPAQRTP